MNLFFEEFLNRLSDLHTEVMKALESLPQDALDFKPAEDIPSICVLVVHLTGAERYWIGDVVASDPSGRDREAEFRSRGLPVSVLKERLDAAITYMQNQLDSFTEDDLTGVRLSPRDGRKFTVAWSLLHILEHTAIHLGHIQIIRQLWYQNHP